MEAMSVGLPVVAGNIGPISELCDDGVEARFWPLDDPAQAAATVIDLLDSEPALQKAACAARARFHRDFDADLIAPRLLDFLMGTPSSAPDDAPMKVSTPELDIAQGPSCPPSRVGSRAGSNRQITGTNASTYVPSEG
jgi:hypothetical protein